MTNLELNQYIFHYIKDNHTKSAIMLTAGWGTGKSYYIQNDLIPFLAEKENGAYSCLVVSLYGLKTVEDISKNLYLELRLKFLRNNSEGLAVGKFVAKTVAKGITNRLGIDLSKSEEELQELYQSIDLSKKLVIFEDIERSKIDIVDILSYTYNLVEQDNVKVLLVANEEEILKYNNSEPDENGRTHKIPDEKTLFYLTIKEKTISDTISYRGDLRVAIANMLQSFGNETLCKFSDKDGVEGAIDVMENLKNFNLRSFQFSCQKTLDILNRTTPIDEKNIRTIYFSVLSFAMRIKNGDFPDWDGTDYLSTKLGTVKFPLYRFCYDYIRWQEFDAAKVQKTFDAHDKMNLYNKHGDSVHDVDLSVLFAYYNHSEKEVLDALHNIEKRLKNPNDIPLYSYSKLAYYLIVCHVILKFDYIPCKEKMVLNMQKYGKDIDADILFLDIFEHESKIERQLFEDFMQSIKEAINTSVHSKLDFSYRPEEIVSLYQKVIKNEAKMITGHTFISKFDLEKTVNMVFQCNPAQLQDWRGILLAIYRNASKRDFLDMDCSFMNKLVVRIQNILPEREKHMDRIALLQIRYLLSNLEEFIEKLS